MRSRLTLASAFAALLPFCASSSDPSTLFAPLDEGFYHELDGTSVSAGFHHTCALEMRTDLDFGGALRCWGADEFGQSSPPSGHFIQVTSGHTYVGGGGCGGRVATTGERTDGLSATMVVSVDRGRGCLLPLPTTRHR